ncbi:hypothetical protein EVAR_52036_1 [Eumeta japonica]|uniref:Uncharacterized protein n=1 Tax=Eumeta variegata TaxID=151549 RepID=A0A4C1Z9A8_EUMVA|nr:hypothetical protein EVAR_52036_1 [Eumeta japonica]
MFRVVTLGNLTRQHVLKNAVSLDDFLKHTNECRHGRRTPSKRTWARQLKASVVCCRCLSSARTHRPMEWKRERQAGHLGRSCLSIACSALSLARSTETERDNESCFVVRAVGIRRFIRLNTPCATSRILTGQDHTVPENPHLTSLKSVSCAPAVTYSRSRRPGRAARSRRRSLFCVNDLALTEEAVRAVGPRRWLRCCRLGNCRAAPPVSVTPA